MGLIVAARRRDDRDDSSDETHTLSHGPLQKGFAEIGDRSCLCVAVFALIKGRRAAAFRPGLFSHSVVMAAF